MLSDEKIKRLQGVWPQKDENVARLVYKLYRYYTTRVAENGRARTKAGYNPGFIYMLANIGIHGSTNKELSHKAMVSKQSMSRLINEMTMEKIVEIEKDIDDGRSNKIMLTDAGAEILIDILENNPLIIEEFEKHIGEDKTKQLLSLMSELIDSIDAAARNR